MPGLAPLGMFYSDSGVTFIFKLLGQGYVWERLKLSLRKCYGRYVDLIHVKHYEVSFSKMLHDILGHDHYTGTPSIDQIFQ